MTDIKRYKLDAAFMPLMDYDHFAKADSFVEVSLWHNDEGFDVHLNSYETRRISMTWGEFKALKKLIKELNQ